MISGYLSELVKIEPFSVDTRSGGSLLVFQVATLASSVKTSSGLVSEDIGMLFAAKNPTNSFII